MTASRPKPASQPLVINIFLLYFLLPKP